MSAFVLRHEPNQLIAKYRAATWLKHDDRRTRVDLVGKRGQNFSQVAPGVVKKTVVVQRTSAAKMLSRHVHPVSKMLQHFERGLRSLRQEVVIECVSPQNDF